MYYKSLKAARSSVMYNTVMYVNTTCSYIYAIDVSSHNSAPEKNHNLFVTLPKPRRPGRAVTLRHPQQPGKLKLTQTIDKPTPPENWS